MTKRLLLISILAVSSTLLACGVLARWACGEPDGDCNIPPEPAHGSPSDVTLAGQRNDRATVSEALFCEAVGEQQTHILHISTLGSEVDPDRSAWISDRLLPELRVRDLSPGRGLTPCPHPNDDNDISYGFITSDWSDVDPILETIMDVAEQDDVVIDLSIVVEPVITYCAQTDEACGT